MNGCKFFLASALAGTQLALAAPALAVSPQQGGGAQSVPFVWRAQDLHDAIGVSTHITYTDVGSAYAKLSLVLQRLQWLGVTSVRDSIPMFTANDPRLNLYYTTLKTGMHMSLVSAGDVGGANNEHITPTPGFASIMDAMRANLDNLETRFPGQIIGIEGENEPVVNSNAYTFTYKSLLGPAAVAQFQLDLYGMVKSDARLKHIDVWEFALASPPYGKEQYEEVYASKPGVMNAFDVAAIGVYGGTWCPEYQIKQTIVEPFDIDFKNHAFVYGPYNPSVRGMPGGVKETGLTSSPHGIPALNISDDAIQAKMLPYTIMDTFKLGSQHTNIYELGDLYPDPSLSHIGYHFGLFDNALNPKPAAYVLKNILAKMADPAADAKTFTPDPMNVSVHEFPLGQPGTDSNQPHVVPSGYSLATQKSNGDLQILVWWEPKIYEGGVDLTPPPRQSINVGLSRNCATTEIYDPNTNVTVQGPTHSNMIPISLPDHAVIAVCKG